jgi:hypothetical protein
MLSKPLYLPEVNQQWKGNNVIFHAFAFRHGIRDWPYRDLAGMDGFCGMTATIRGEERVRWYSGLLGASLLACMTQLVMAAHPFITDDTGTQGTGRRQLEVNTDRLDYSGIREHSGAFTFTYGVTPHIDLFGNLPVQLSSPSGINDISVGLKWRMWEEGNTSLAIKPELVLPTGNEDKGLGNGNPGMQATVLLTHSTGPWNLHANLGLTRNSYRASEAKRQFQDKLWRASVAASYALGDQFRLVADLGTERNIDRSNRKRPAFALIGIIYAPTDAVDLDIGIKAGLNDAEADRQVGAGLTFRF